MATTKQIPRAQWQQYFDRFTRQHLGDDVPKAATMELVSPKAGDQVEASAARLLGLSYDPQRKQFKVLLEDVDYLLFEPAEIWVLEEDWGFVSAVELAYEDGSKEIIFVRLDGPPARRIDQPSPPQG